MKNTVRLTRDAVHWTLGGELTVGVLSCFEWKVPYLDSRRRVLITAANGEWEFEVVPGRCGVGETALEGLYGP